MPGSTVTTAPAGRGASAVLARRGASCTSSPMPWAREGPNAPPNPARRYRIAREGVGLPAGHAGLDLLARPALRLADDLIDLALPVVRRPDHDGPGEVGAVPPEPAPEVQQQPITEADRAGARAGMGKRAAGA